MQSLGSSNASAGSLKKSVFKGSSLSMAVMALVFLVALVFAANENDVIGWLVVIISLGWLLLAAFVVLGIRKGARKVTAEFTNAKAGLARNQGGTVVVDEAASARDLKLDHSFKIIQVQLRVVRENLGKDQGMVDRALETIEITASNARGMMKRDGGAPLSGEVIN
jgi:hypothetical protein